MASNLKWKALSEEQLQKLQIDLQPGAESAEQVKQMLAGFLGVKRADVDQRAKIVVDFHFFNLAFSKAQGFLPVKTSTLCSILQQVIDADVSAAHRDIRQSFEMFRELLLTHAVQRPPWSVQVFEDADVEAILQHVLHTYYRHFRLYRFVLCPEMSLQIQQELPGRVSVPGELRPLDEAVEVTGKVAEEEFSEEELRLIEQEVEKRVAPMRARIEQEKADLEAELGTGTGSDGDATADGGKKSKKRK